MDYRELANKYLRAETSLEEEQLLREHSAEALSDDERAVGAILSHNAAQREQGVNIRLRQKSSSVWSIASVLSLCVVVIALTITLRHSSTAEPNIYCYVNGEAVTSESQAQLYAQQVLSNMESEELSNEDFFGTLFTFE